ncbi:hypothetical protein FOCC_FOCC014085 [Frankliniella occidentalis]|nr:hypothetical protein FOCC_FOCC014085 [Frankliniella occidentalis]
MTGSKTPALPQEDKQSATCIIKTGKLKKKSKHIYVRYYFTDEKFEEGLFQLVYCPTEDQLADIFTKPLHVNKFTKFRNMLMH